MSNNYKITWSYKTSDGILHRDTDVIFCELSARDAVRRVLDDYSEYQELRIENVLRECSDCWDYVDPYLWEDID